MLGEEPKCVVMLRGRELYLSCLRLILVHISQTRFKRECRATAAQHENTPTVSRVLIRVKILSAPTPHTGRRERDRRDALGRSDEMAISTRAREPSPVNTSGGDSFDSRPANSPRTANIHYAQTIITSHNSSISWLVGFLRNWQEDRRPTLMREPALLVQVRVRYSKYKRAVLYYGRML